MIGFCPLASGSKGNALYFSTGKTKLLVDAGLSGRATTQRLAAIGVGVEEIDAILITHDHGDHIQGLRTLAFKHKIPVIANADTAKGIVHHFGQAPRFKIFSTGEPFIFADLTITPFSIMHDTLDPVAFVLEADGMRVGICTDLGQVTPIVKHHLQGCDYLVLEANHEPSLVHASERPMVYKQRVLSSHGHLHNRGAAELLVEIAHPGLKHVHLAHLSEECNRPEAALQVVQEMLQKYAIEIPISVAHQHQNSSPITF